jgi:hypothetical protein
MLEKKEREKEERVVPLAYSLLIALMDNNTCE